MNRVYLFLKRTHLVLLFVVLELFTLRYYLGSTPYTRAKLAVVSNFIIGGVDARVEKVKTFFNFVSENRRLTQELAQANYRLEQLRHTSKMIAVADSATVDIPYKYMTGAVINNSISLRHNYFTVDKGLNDNVCRDMAVVSGRNIVGYVVESSEQFSVCISLLNVDFKTSGRIEGDEHTGIISWDGVDREYLTLSDVPKYADISIGDTVVTTNYSAIFPEGLVIGTISEFEMVNMTSYKAKVRVAARMGALNNVMLIFNRDTEQRAQLENKYYNNNRK